VTFSESEIKLTQGKWALIDNEDLGELQKHKWHARKCPSGYYAVSSHGVYMHRLLLNFPQDDVDHINGNRLDNRRSNICQADCSQNGFNRAGVVGVRRVGPSWQANITCQYKTYTATFKSKEEALKWRRQKATELYGVRGCHG
jgi:hypothetical protein